MSQSNASVLKRSRSSGRLHRNRGRRGGYANKDNRSSRLLSLPSVCVCVCVCVKPGVYCSWTRVISEEGARPVVLAASALSSLPYPYSSPPLSPSPISDQLAASGVSLHQSLASLCGKHSHLSSPSPHPVQWLPFFFFYFDAVAWKKKRGGRGEGGGGGGEARLPRAESCRRRWLRIDRQPLGHGCRASVVNGSQRLMKGGWVEDEMMGGRGWRRTGGGRSRDGLK